MSSVQSIMDLVRPLLRKFLAKCEYCEEQREIFADEKRPPKERQIAWVTLSSFAHSFQERLAKHNAMQMSEREYCDNMRKKARNDSNELLFIMLDAMGHDLSDCPWWFRKTKTKFNSKLPVRIMGATISGLVNEQMAILISEFTKEVSYGCGCSSLGKY